LRLSGLKDLFDPCPYFRRVDKVAAIGYFKAYLDSREKANFLSKAAAEELTGEVFSRSALCQGELFEVSPLFGGESDLHELTVGIGRPAVNRELPGTSIQMIFRVDAPIDVGWTLVIVVGNCLVAAVGKRERESNAELQSGISFSSVMRQI
jgi:hypothetical protein